jgi:hypothetical protein
MEESIGRIVKKWVIQEFQFRTMVYGTMDFGFLYCRQGSVACWQGGGGKNEKGAPIPRQIESGWEITHLKKYSYFRLGL